MRDDLGVGVGRELVAEAAQPGAHLLVVLDDAVVHHRDPARDVRVGVPFRGHAVRRPAGVADADRAVQAPGELFQLGNPAAGANTLHGAVDDGDAGRVVAAILEAAQALDQDRHDVSGGYGSDDSAHTGSFPGLRLISATAAKAPLASASRSRRSAPPAGWN